MAKATVLIHQGTIFLPTVPFVRRILVKAAFVIVSVKRVKDGGSSKGRVYVNSILYFSQSAFSGQW